MSMKLPHPLAHAYIITGGSAPSRLDCARRMAAAYLCREEGAPCGLCRHCVKVEKNIHPDVTVCAVPEGKREIPVDQIRALRGDMYVLPNEGERKVCIIDPADAMNEHAQNALLKVLEDGPAYAAFLLLTHQPGQLLDTIRSRCETLSLPPEEEAPDPELEEKAEELTRLLLTGSEWELARYAVGLEQSTAKSADILALFAAAEPMLVRALPENRRAVRALEALRWCRDTAVFNMGAGHLLGWLCARMFRDSGA